MICVCDREATSRSHISGSGIFPDELEAGQTHEVHLLTVPDGACQPFL